MSVLLSKIPVVAAQAAAVKGRVKHSVVHWAFIMVCAMTAFGFVVAGLYQALSLVLGPPWPPLIVAAFLGSLALIVWVIHRVAQRRAKRQRRAEIDPIILAAAGFMVGALSGSRRTDGKIDRPRAPVSQRSVRVARRGG